MSPGGSQCSVKRRHLLKLTIIARNTRTLVALAVIISFHTKCIKTCHKSIWFANQANAALRAQIYLE